MRLKRCSRGTKTPSSRHVQPTPPVRYSRLRNDSICSRQPVLTQPCKPWPTRSAPLAHSARGWHLSSNGVSQTSWARARSLLERCVTDRNRAEDTSWNRSVTALNQSPPTRKRWRRPGKLEFVVSDCTRWSRRCARIRFDRLPCLRWVAVWAA